MRINDDDEDDFDRADENGGNDDNYYINTDQSLILIHFESFLCLLLWYEITSQS